MSQLTGNTTSHEYLLENGFAKLSGKKIFPKIDVLLLDAECRQTLACLRGFHRAGLKTGAVAGEAVQNWAPAHKSKWCDLKAIVPDYSDNPNEYVNGLVKILKEFPTEVVIPFFDGSIEALRMKRNEIEQHSSLALGGESALSIAVSKTKTQQLATELGIRVPRSIQLSDLKDLRSALKEVGKYAVLKPDQSWVEAGGNGQRVTCHFINSEYDAERSLEYIFNSGGRAMIQEWIPGKREAVTLFYARNQFWARFAQVSYREWPVNGGVSAMCEGISLIPDITEASEKLIRAMNLEGPSMVEFRRSHQNQPVLMEVNPRMGGSVGLAIRSGVDFPNLTYDWALGRPMKKNNNYKTGLFWRWLAADIWNLKDTLSDNGGYDFQPKGRAALNFVADFIKHPDALNPAAVTDFGPAIIEFQHIVGDRVQNRIKRSAKNLLHYK